MTPFGSIISILRPSQWIKNAFVLAPLVFAGRTTCVDCVLKAIGAALYFSLASSMAYVFNDIADLKSDREDPEKSRTRPLASGEMTVGQAWALLVVLGLLLSTGFFTIGRAMEAAAAYLILNVAYTLWLKKEVIVDIFCIAIGFLLRVWAGGLAIELPISEWMFVSVLCLALYLGSVKRLCEIRRGGKRAAYGKNMNRCTESLLASYAQTSQTAAIVFYGLFVVTEKPRLWITLPLVIYAFFRYQYLATCYGKGEIPGETIFGDRYLSVCVLIWALLCIAVSTG